MFLEGLFWRDFGLGVRDFNIFNKYLINEGINFYKYILGFILILFWILYFIL